MMPILVKSDDVRSGRKAKVRHGWLRGGGTGVNRLRNIFRLKLTENEERSALVG